MGSPVRDDVGHVARRFLEAIVWGEHLVVWDMLSPAGREYVLAAGERRGLDPMQAQRIRLGTSPTEERDSFLSGLVHGLRVDFSLVPLEDVQPTEDIVEREDGTLDVPLECPASFGAGGWSAGTLVVSRQGDTFLIDRVKPVVTGEE